MVAAATVAISLLLGAGPAAAHAVLVETDPADGQVLADSPDQVTVTFNEPVSLAAHGNQLLDAQGTEVPADISALDAQVLLVPAEPLRDGTYVVTWRVISADTHAVAGGITFSVGAPSGSTVAMPGTDGDPQVTLARQLVEALRYAGILGFAGLVIFTVVIAREATRHSAALRGQLRMATRGFAILAATAAALLAPLVTLWQNGQGFGGLGDPALWRQAIGTPAAATFVAIAGGIVVAWLALSRPSASRPRPEWAAAGVALLLGALLIEGHTRTFGPPWLVLPADLLHVTTAALWFGGLIGLILVLIDRDLDAGHAAIAVGRFSSAALYLVIALAGAAVLLWSRIGQSFSALWSTYYGELVLIKAGLATVVVALAAWNRFRLVPAITAQVATSPPADSGPLRTRLRRSVAAEALILIAVIGITGVLVTQRPEPVAAAGPTAPPAVTITADGITAEITLAPGAVGTNALHLSLTDDGGQPLDLYEDQAPTLSVTLTGTSVGPFRHELVPLGEANYEAMVNLPLPGSWTVTVTVRTSQFDSPVLSTEVTVS